MTSDITVHLISVLTFLALKVSLTYSEPSMDVHLSDVPDLSSIDADRMRSLYSLLEDSSIPDKRRSLFRFGKRRSLFRFGKRGSIMRFGKRPDLEGFEESEFMPVVPSNLFGGFHEDPRADAGFVSQDKRSSIFRFGKKSRATDNLFERHTAKEKKPHTPWRFGRYLDGELGELPLDKQ